MKKRLLMRSRFFFARLVIHAPARSQTRIEKAERKAPTLSPGISYLNSTVFTPGETLTAIKMSSSRRIGSGWPLTDTCHPFAQPSLKTRCTCDCHSLASIVIFARPGSSISGSGQGTIWPRSSNRNLGQLRFISNTLHLCPKSNGTRTQSAS